MRTLLFALLATVASIPAMASAQEDDRSSQPERARFEAPRARSNNDEAAPAARREFRESRPSPRVEVDVDARAAARFGRNRDANGEVARRRFDPAPFAQPRPAPAVPQLQAQPRRDWNRNAADRTDGRGRDWGRNDGGQRDWNRGDGRNRDSTRADTNRRDWNRDDRRDRDWNRNGGGNARDWNRNGDGRYGWDRSDRRADDRNVRSWDRSWRNNNRYDWQRYRSSNRSAFRLSRYSAPYGWQSGYRRQSIGAYLFAGLFAQDYWINDPWQYRLPPVYWPYQWVRYYDDALLVDTRTGYVVDVIPDIFWY